MSDKVEYKINTDVKFQPLELIDIPAIIEANTEPWFNQTLTGVNDCVVRLGIVKGEFHWHKHDEEDEFFYVVGGKFTIELENGRVVDLHKGQGFTVPKGVMHYPHSREGAVILMVEGAGVVPTGDGSS